MNKIIFKWIRARIPEDQFDLLRIKLIKDKLTVQDWLHMCVVHYINNK